MAFRVERSEAADRDLDAISRFLVETAVGFGDAVAEANSKSESRLQAIEQALQDLGAAPHQGTLHPWLGPGVRNVTKGRAVIYFEADDAAELVRILAVFYGGQDHRRRMLRRLLAEED